MVAAPRFDSIRVVEEQLLGDDLDEKGVIRLAEAPDYQLAQFLGKFAEVWYEWFEQEGQRNRSIEAKPLYLASGIRSADPVSMSLDDYKRLALCFDQVAVPDPLAEALHAAVEVGNLLGQINVAAARLDFRVGLSRLAEIAPLVRSGACVLVPHTFCGVHPEVQALARAEIDRAPVDDRGYPERFDAGAYAVALGLTSSTGAWPFVDRLGVYERLKRGLRSKLPPQRATDLEVTRAQVRFGLPDPSGVSVELLTKLRSDEDAFAEFRVKLTGAIAHASRVAGESPELFSEFLQTELEDAARRCRDVVKFSPALDGTIGPAAATFMLAAAKVA